MTNILIRDGIILTPTGWLDPGYVLIAGETIQSIGPGEPTPEMLAQAQTVCRDTPPYLAAACRTNCQFVLQLGRHHGDSQ